LTREEWVRAISELHDTFRRKYYFFHPVRCSDGSSTTDHVKTGSTEVYKCPGECFAYQRSKKTSDFFRLGYGRCGEFAQAAMAILISRGADARLMVAHVGAFQHAWVVARPGGTRRRWTTLDTTVPWGVGRTIDIPKEARVFSTDTDGKCRPSEPPKVVSA
jgi:hypothetical protein